MGGTVVCHLQGFRGMGVLTVGIARSRLENGGCTLIRNLFVGRVVAGFMGVGRGVAVFIERGVAVFRGFFILAKHAHEGPECIFIAFPVEQFGPTALVECVGEEGLE